MILHWCNNSEATKEISWRKMYFSWELFVKKYYFHFSVLFWCSWHSPVSERCSNVRALSFACQSPVFNMSVTCQFYISGKTSLCQWYDNCMAVTWQLHVNGMEIECQRHDNCRSLVCLLFVLVMAIACQ